MKKTLIVCIIMMIFSICISAENIVTNGDFLAESDGEPIGWSLGGDNRENSEFLVENGAFKISSVTESHSYATQMIYVEPEQIYKFSAEIKTENVSGFGASLGFLDKASYSDAVTGTKDFTKISMYFITGETNVPITLSLGSYESGVSGTVYFRDVSIEPVDSVQEGAKYFRYVEENTEEKPNENSQKKTFDMRWIILIAVTVAVIGVSVFYLYKKN